MPPLHRPSVNTFYLNPLSLIPSRCLPWNVRCFLLPTFVLIWKLSNFFPPALPLLSPSLPRPLISHIPFLFFVLHSARILWESFSHRQCLISAKEKTSRRVRTLASPSPPPSLSLSRARPFSFRSRSFSASSYRDSARKWPSRSGEWRIRQGLSSVFNASPLLSSPLPSFSLLLCSRAVGRSS